MLRLAEQAFLRGEQGARPLTSMEPPSSTTALFRQTGESPRRRPPWPCRLPIFSSCCQLGYFAQALNRHLMAEPRRAVLEPDACGRPAEWSIGSNKGASRVASPHPIGWPAMKANVVAERVGLAPGPCGQAFPMPRSLTISSTRSCRAQVADDFGIDPGDRLELSRPVAAIMRPGEPGGGVRFPFGGHAIADSVGWFMDSVESFELPKAWRALLALDGSRPVPIRSSHQSTAGS